MYVVGDIYRMFMLSMYGNECCYLPFVRRVGDGNFKFVMVLNVV